MELFRLFVVYLCTNAFVCEVFNFFGAGMFLV